MVGARRRPDDAPAYRTRGARAGGRNGEAQRACRRRGDPVRIEPARRCTSLGASLLSWAIRHLWTSRDFTRAAEIGRRALADSERLLGVDHPTTMTVRNDFA